MYTKRGWPSMPEPQLLDWFQQCPADYEILRSVLAGVKLVQVVHVIDKESFKEALTIADYVDVLLLDSGNPHLAGKELGGTGRTHNWEISKKIVDKIKIPAYLAGGLNWENVREAIDIVQPFGVDVCSGVRTNGKLDRLKLETFSFNALRNT